MKKSTYQFVASIGDKVRNRHTQETAIVASISVNQAGAWYYMETDRAMSVGWWHETDLAAAPKTMPPSTKRKADKEQAA